MFGAISGGGRGFWDVALRDQCAINAGASVRGIGIQVIVLKEPENEFHGAVVYLDVAEARAFVAKVLRAIEEIEGR